MNNSLSLKNMGYEMWTREEREQFAKSLILTCRCFDKEISIDLVQLFMCDLEDLPFNLTMQGLSMYRLDKKNRTWPRIGDLRAYADPSPIDSREQASEIAQKCFGAIRKFGWTKSQEAREFIGEEGWEVIQRRGGWQAHCESTLEREVPILTAQFRDSLVPLIDKAKREKENDVFLKLDLNIVKSLV
jgi:hypothetical protein